MSNLTSLVHGRLTPEEFVTKSAADIKKDLAIFQKFPGYAKYADWAMDLLEKAIVARGLSPFFADIVCDQIRTLLGIPLDTAPPPMP